MSHWLSAHAASERHATRYDFWSMGTVPIVVTLNGIKHQWGNHTEYIPKPGVSGRCRRRRGSEGGPRTHICPNAFGGEESRVRRSLFALSHYFKQQISLMSTSKYSSSPPYPWRITSQDPPRAPEATDTTEPDANSVFLHTHMPFHFKEALPRFPLVCLNRQQHDSCALGPSLSGTRVTCTQAL